MSKHIDESWLGQPIEDPSEETFQLFSQGIPSTNLGFVNSSSSVVDIDIGSRSLTLKQSPSILNSNRSGGTTGAVLWRITPLVAEWLSSWPNVLTQASILDHDSVLVELGCGITGLIGTLLSPMVSRYILTDQKYVAKTLQDNLEANGQYALRRQARQRHIDKPLFVAFDWEADHAASLIEHVPKHKRIDLVIACDCVYNDHLIVPLVEALGDLCSLAVAEDRCTYALVAQQLRSDQVMEQFFSSLMERFCVWRIPDEQLPSALKTGSGYALHIARLRP